MELYGSCIQFFKKVYKLDVHLHTGLIHFGESRNENILSVISLDIKSDLVTNEHATHFDVNLLTEIFRDTHTPPPATSRPSRRTYTDVPREHLYRANQTRIHRGRGTAYISLNTSREAKRRKNR